MKLFDLKNYVYDKEFHIIIKDNYVNIINFDKVIDINEQEILVKNGETIIRINGNNLLLNKLLNNEILVKGDISSIKFKDE